MTDGRRDRVLRNRWEEQARMRTVGRGERWGFGGRLTEEVIGGNMKRQIQTNASRLLKQVLEA